MEQELLILRRSLCETELTTVFRQFSNAHQIIDSYYRNGNFSHPTIMPTLTQLKQGSAICPAYELFVIFSFLSQRQHFFNLGCCTYNHIICHRIFIAVDDHKRRLKNVSDVVSKIYFCSCCQQRIVVGDLIILFGDVKLLSCGLSRHCHCLYMI